MPFSDEKDIASLTAFAVSEQLFNVAITEFTFCFMFCSLNMKVVKCADKRGVSFGHQNAIGSFAAEKSIFVTQLMASWSYFWSLANTFSVASVVALNSLSKNIFTIPICGCRNGQVGRYSEFQTTNNGCSEIKNYSSKTYNLDGQIEGVAGEYIHKYSLS
jgi:hypothetical protein